MKTEKVWVGLEGISNGKHCAIYGEMKEPVIVLVENGAIEEIRFYNGARMSKQANDFSKHQITILTETEAVLLSKEQYNAVTDLANSVLDHLNSHLNQDCIKTPSLNTIAVKAADVLKILNK